MNLFFFGFICEVCLKFGDARPRIVRNFIKLSAFRSFEDREILFCVLLEMEFEFGRKGPS